MQGSPSRSSKTLRTEKPRFIMVSVGILLFVAGFLVTLMAIESDHAGSTDSDAATLRGETRPSSSAGVYILSGILISLVGVVLATVGPAAGMVRGRS